jgi:hypothetical protein
MARHDVQRPKRQGRTPAKAGSGNGRSQRTRSRTDRRSADPEHDKQVKALEAALMGDTRRTVRRRRKETGESPLADSSEGSGPEVAPEAPTARKTPNVGAPVGRDALWPHDIAEVLLLPALVLVCCYYLGLRYFPDTVTRVIDLAGAVVEKRP